MTFWMLADEGEKRSNAFLRARSDLEQGRRRLLNVPVAVGMDFEQEKFLPDPQTPEEERDYSRSRTRWPYSLKSQRLIMISVICLVLIGTYLLSTIQYTIVLRRKLCDTTSSGYQCQPKVSHNWGQYSPFFAVESDINPDMPSGCEITFAQVLSRHGARDPTASKTVMYANLIQKIKTTVTQYKGDYAFLKDYTYNLGADQLTVFGEQQMVNSGIEFFNRYQHLATHFPLFVRAASQNRVVVSAQNFSQGYHHARRAATGSEPVSYPYNVLVISEDAGQNNTLSHGQCMAFETRSPYTTTGSSAQKTYQDIFLPPLTARINANLPPISLTASETISFLDLCSFNTVASPTGHISPFCGLFTENEWQQYSYYQTLGKFYGFGPGNDLGPTQGVGYVNELIARLTGTAVNDHTSVNHTLDDESPPSTFPVGNAHPLFADFSHDNDMTSIFAALGLFAANHSLSNATRENEVQANGYSAAWTVPFAARAYFEKMRCGNDDKEELVRAIVNGRVVPLQGCGADKKGRCKLSNFINSLSFAKSGGRWADC